ncbi:MAG: hypothetical protein IJM59_02970, partial [Proteobacteria bacterium]|nr:hypothetical protein [Pseudomonadota bacterium]
CQDECTENDVQCDGDTALKTCKADENGCLKWVSENCPKDTTCSENECKAKAPQCKNQCSGTTQCDGTSGYKTCKDTNGDGCKEWTAVTKCPSGQECKNGACAAIACKYKSTTDPGIHPLPGEGSYGKSEATTKNGYSDEYLYDADNYIKVGVRRDWGGSIIFFGLADGNPGTNGSNTIDGNDTGREVQVAIYDASRQMQGCAYNASCGSSPQCPGSITYLGWNPVQGGNRCNRGSGVQSVTNKNGILEVVTVPLHWNPNWDDATGSCTSNGCDTSATWARKSDVTLTQRLRFVRKHVAELFYSVHNDGNLNHTASHQELPTLYATYGAHGFGNYNRLMTASKEQININEPANDGFFTKAFQSKEPWVTLQNANLDYGVGILYENGLLDYQGWQKDGVFNNVRSLIKFGLPPNGTVNARAYLILGSYDLIASEAKTLMSTLPPFGVLDIPDGKTAVTGNVSLSGWALDNRGVTKVTARIDEGTPVTLTYGADRSDVCAVWVGYPKCNKVGFSGSISVAGLSKECPHLLEIMATDTDNNTRTIARRIINVK